MNCLRTSAFKLFLLLSLTLAIAPLALGSSFSIEDYKPINFDDLEWYINGSFRANGNNNQSESNTVYTDHWLSNTIRNSRETTNFDQLISLDNWIVYERVRPNSDLGLFIGLKLDGHHTDQDNNEISFDSLLNSVSDLNERENNSYRVNLNVSSRTIWYTSGNFFLRPLIHGNWQQSEVVGSDWENERTSAYLNGDYYQISQSQTIGTRPTLNRRRSTGLGLNVGFGRIYRGYYGATALYLIEELESKGLLGRNPSRSQLRELSAIIHKYKEQHAIDKRIHKIKSLKALIGYLERAEIIDDYGADSYLHILDVWDFFPRHYRSFGFEVGGGVALKYSDRFSSQTDEYDSRHIRIEYHQDSLFARDTVINESQRHLYISQSFESRSISAQANIEYHKPIDLKWQLDIYATGELVLDGYNSQQRDYIQYDTISFIGDQYRDIRSDIDKSSYVSLRTNLTYIMDSRSLLRGSVGVSRHKETKDSFKYEDFEGVRIDEQPDSASTTSIFFTGNLSLDYRLTIPTTFTCSLNYNYRNNESGFETLKEYRKHQYHLGIGIRHYLF